MIERRRSVRTQIHKSAKILFGESSMVSCVVRDLTHAGAGIEIPSAIALPEVLELTFDGGHSIRRGLRVWRILHRAGVEFE